MSDGLKFAGPRDRQSIRRLRNAGVLQILVGEHAHLAAALAAAFTTETARPAATAAHRRPVDAGLAPGTYFLRLAAPNGVSFQKIVVLP